MIEQHYRPFITPEEVGSLARPCDMDRGTVERAVEEAALLDIRPKLGDALYLRLCEGVKYGLLLDGGSYITKNGEVRVFGGLKRALAYYAWGRLVKSAGSRLTRFGYVGKNDDYSHAVDFKDRMQAYNGAFEIADTYMNECRVYMRDNPDLFPDFRGRFASGGLRTRTIGK